MRRRIHIIACLWLGAPAAAVAQDGEPQGSAEEQLSLGLVAVSSGSSDESGETEEEALLPATSEELMGMGCSLSTESMLRTVHNKGRQWTYTGRMERTDVELPSAVAAPFVVGARKARVLSNKVLEQLMTSLGETPNEPVTLRGRLLDQRGIRYFVVTEAAVNGSENGR